MLGYFSYFMTTFNFLKIFHPTLFTIIYGILFFNFYF